MISKLTFRPRPGSAAPSYPRTAARRGLAAGVRAALLLGVGLLGAYGGCMPLPPAAIDPTPAQQRRLPVAAPPDGGGTVVEPLAPRPAASRPAADIVAPGGE